MPNCMICQQADLPREETIGWDGDIVMGNGDGPSTPAPAGPSASGADLQNGMDAAVEQHLKFRCTRCTQSAHYEHCKLRPAGKWEDVLNSSTESLHHRPRYRTYPPPDCRVLPTSGGPTSGGLDLSSVPRLGVESRHGELEYAQARYGSG
jgi:hypothetical protein